VEWAWRLASVRRPLRGGAAGKVNDLGAFYQVTNGLTGVRVVKAAGNPARSSEPRFRGSAWASGLDRNRSELPVRSYSQKLRHS